MHCHTLQQMAVAYCTSTAKASGQVCEDSEQEAAQLQVLPGRLLPLQIKSVAVKPQIVATKVPHLVCTKTVMLQNQATISRGLVQTSW
jgi:hypothetical protein